MAKAFVATDSMRTGWIANILATYRRADEALLADGRAWYPGMHAVMRAHADETGLTVRQCAAIYAANSINTPWARNVSLASGALADIRDGRAPYANGGTLGMIIRKVSAIIDGADIDTTLSADPNNLKIRSFCANMSGDYDAVTVDRWAMRIAYGLTSGGYVPTGEEYRAIADAYRAVAVLVGETPATVQAVSWCVIRGTGE